MKFYVYVCAGNALYVYETCYVDEVVVVFAVIFEIVAVILSC